MRWLKKSPTPLALILVFALLLINYPGRGFDWTWIYRWTLLYGAFFIWTAHIMSRSSVGVLPSAVFLYFALHGLVFSQTAQISGADILAIGPLQTTELDSVRVVTALRYAASMALTIVALVPFFLAGGYGRFFTRILPLALLSVGTVVALGVIGWGDKNHVPLTHFPSMTATWLAILLPLAPWPIAVLFVLAIIKTKAATALACAFVALALTHYRRIWFWALCLLASPVAWIWVQPKLASGNGRFPVWNIAMGLIERRPWFGWGLGSTAVITPLAQIRAGYEFNAEHFFMFLHNDWLEILLNVGAVGLGFAVALYSAGCAISSGTTRAAWVTLGVAMLTNFPLHFPLAALTAFMLLGRIFYARSR